MLVRGKSYPYSLVSTAEYVQVVVFRLTDVSCSLALCEIYIMAALMAFRIIPKAELFETTIEDLTYDHDLVVLQTKKGHISTQIKIA